MTETKAERSDAGRIERASRLSDEVLASVEASQRAAIDAVQKFVDTVDEKMPVGEHPSRQREVIDAALLMADRLVHTQYDFMRKVVHSAGTTLDGEEPKA